MVRPASRLPFSQSTVRRTRSEATHLVGVRVRVSVRVRVDREEDEERGDAPG